MTRTVVQILGHGDIAELARADRTDGQLLDLFVRQRDQEAFAAVVRRHGPMVLGVCRRVLRNDADADDAFQAAFLVLARKAASLSRRERLAQWLHGVAFNTARKLRRTNARRATREVPLAEAVEPPAAGGSELRDELTAILDEELARLPERYRLPIVLCDLQGATRKEAARQLGCPEGTVAGRLARARALLAERLTARGVVPVAALLAVLAERAGAVSPALVAAVVRAAAGGTISPRAAEVTEGVLKAMFAKKLRAVAAAVFLCGFVLACAAGLVHVATASADPPAPLATDNAAPQKPTPEAKPGDKVLTVIPLKKLDAEETAKQLRDLYRGQPVTVAALRDDKSLMLYADEKTTKEIEELLVKIGEPPRKKATAIPIPGLPAAEIAGKLNRLIPSTTSPVVVAASGEETLLVYGTDAETQEIRDAVEAITGQKPAKPAPAPSAAQKTYTVKFVQVPWKDVIEWYAEISGLIYVGDVVPKGTVTIKPPANRKFTLGEVTDLINEALVAQKYILIRRHVTFLVHPADERIDPTLVPRIELSDLPTRGKAELVQVLLPLKNLSVEDTTPEVQKMLTPFGQVSMLTKSNTLVIVDTAGNINRIYDTLQKLERIKPPAPGDPELRKYSVAPGTAEAVVKALQAHQPSLRIVALSASNEIMVLATPEEHAALATMLKWVYRAGKKAPETLTYSCKNGNAQEIADKLKTLFPPAKPAAGYPNSSESPFDITADEKKNTITVTGPPAAVAQIKGIIEDLDY